MTDRGHRVVDHTADEIVEAWAPTRAECLEEAVAGFVATFAAGLPDAGAHTTNLQLPGDDDTDLLLGVLGELVYLLDAESTLPVAAHVDDRGETVVVRLDLVDAADVQPVGAAPKGVAHSGLELSTDGHRWTARALIDI